MSGLFEHGYPYTDSHEINLSWVILKVKELAEAWAQVQQDWTDEQAAFANLQSWIENYFNNLNVQTEINVKLDAMVAAGTMSELIAPYVASGLPAEVAAQIGDVVAAQIGPVVAAQISAVVADQLPAVAAAAAATEVGTWLSTHIDPDTGYVIDDTFTVQGAAADAKAVGDEFTALKSALSDIVTAKNPFTFYQGGLGNLNQNINILNLVTATNRIRSISDLTDKTNTEAQGNYILVVECDDGYSALVQFFAKDDGNPQYSSVVFKVGKLYYTCAEDSYAVCVIKKVDNSDLTPSDATHVNIYYISLVDKAQNESIQDINYKVLGESLFETMYQGGFGGATQGNSINVLSINSDTNRIRSFNSDTKGFILEANHDLYISADDGYEYAYQVYSVSSNIALDAFGWISTHTHINKNEDVYFIFMGKKSDGSNISTSDASHFRVSYYESPSIKEELDSILNNTNKIDFPFTFNIGVNVYKNENKYITDFRPQSKAITSSNGVVVFLSPNGNDSNDGLTVLTPKKTFASALAVTNVLTLILLEGTYSAGTHFTAGLQITTPINMIGIGNVIIDNVSNQMPIRTYRSLYCENIHFRHGANTLIVELSTSDREACFYHCTFSESNTVNGLSVLGGTCYVVECVAYGNAYDGFNYHKVSGDGGISNNCIEIDCVSYGNGTYNLDGVDGQSSNATTSHDNSKIVRVNGEYYACHGGVVADKECNSANYGCKTGISTVTNYSSYPDRMSNYWCSYGTMWLYDCISYGSKYDTARVNGGMIISDTVYSSNYPS